LYALAAPPPRRLRDEEASDSPARRRYGRQGLLLRRQPLLPAQARDQGGHPVKEDQKNHRRNRGSQGGRPPAFDAEQYKERNTVERCSGKLKQFRAVPDLGCEPGGQVRPLSWRRYTVSRKVPAGSGGRLVNQRST
jgi:hypothetical protein